MKLIGRIGGPVGILTGRTGLPRVLLLALVLVPCLTGGAHAALTVYAGSNGINSPDGYVYDDVNGFYWLRDLSLFTSTAFEQQKTDIGNYQYEDEFNTWDDWRMATQAEMRTIWDQDIGNLETYGGQGYNYDNTYFYRSRQGYPNTYWTGRIDLTRYNGETFETKKCGYWNAGNGNHNIGPTGDYGWISPDANQDVGAWVVRDGTPEIPEPATAALLGVAMLGAAGTLIRKRARQQ